MGWLVWLQGYKHNGITSDNCVQHYNAINWAWISFLSIPLMLQLALWWVLPSRARSLPSYTWSPLPSLPFLLSFLAALVLGILVDCVDPPLILPHDRGDLYSLPAIPTERPPSVAGAAREAERKRPF